MTAITRFIARKNMGHWEVLQWVAAETVPQADTLAREAFAQACTKSPDEIAVFAPRGGHWSRGKVVLHREAQA